MPETTQGHFGNFQGCFLIKEIGTDQISVHNEAQCAKRWKPCSSFKIANSLIGLETGVLKDEYAVYKWNGKKQFFKSWERDHTLASAIKVSAVPYYQELARNIGQKRMNQYVKELAYGNMNIGENIDRFWLDGPLAISAFEQLNFMERLYTDQLPVSKRSSTIVKKIITLESDSNRVLSGKTGSELKNGKVTWGWFVGHVKKGHKEYVFVANIQSDDKAWGGQARKIASAILKDLGILD